MTHSLLFSACKCRILLLYYKHKKNIRFPFSCYVFSLPISSLKPRNRTTTYHHPILSGGKGTVGKTAERKDRSQAIGSLFIRALPHPPRVGIPLAARHQPFDQPLMLLMAETKECKIHEETSIDPPPCGGYARTEPSARLQSVVQNDPAQLGR